MAVEQQTKQLALVTDVGSGETFLAQVDISARRRRGGRQSTYLEQSSALDEWWVTNAMTSLVWQEANTWVQRQSAQILELSNQDSSYSSHVGSSDDAIGKLSEAFHEANFQPIVLFGIARKLGFERRVIKDKLQGMGHWVDEYFNHVIDVLTDDDNGAKPNIKPETKEALMQIIRGKPVRL